MSNDTEKEYLTFLLDGEEFGIDILKVQEIRVWSGVTELPNKPSYFKGVINLRGVIVPIIDLRMRFHKHPLDYDEHTVTIILNNRQSINPMVVGIVVDSVSDVHKFADSSISCAPSFGCHIDSCFLKGLASANNKLVILLDAEHFLSQDELYTLDKEPDSVDELETEDELHGSVR